jgi:uncharacterized protein (DUF983 family)
MSVANPEKKKVSTKRCPDCGCDKLILLYSQNKKICTYCGTHIYWGLDDNQKPLLR